jgi:aminotransferase
LQGTLGFRANFLNGSKRGDGEEEAGRDSEVARRRKLIVISDEIYSLLVYGMEPVCFASLPGMKDHTILLGGFSKAFAMTGWRIGYIVAAKELVDKITKLNQITVNNVPVFIQEAALKALGMHDALTKGIKKEYQERAQMACKILAKARLEFTKPDAPFYVFPRRSGLDSERFALELLVKGVAVAPGTAFGDYREHFRISLTVPRKEIEAGAGYNLDEVLRDADSFLEGNRY